MLSFGRLILVVVVCLVAAPLCAQTASNTRRAFVDVLLGPDWDDTYSDDTRVPGATRGYGLAFGFESGRSGVEFDVWVPQWLANNRAPQRYQYAGPTFGYEQQGHVYESSSTERHRSIDMTVQYRANAPVNRYVTFTGFVGGGIVNRRRQYTFVANEVLPDGQLTEVNRDKREGYSNSLAATAGLDVEFRIAPHVSLVPRLRVKALPSALLDESAGHPRMFTARPEIAVRWEF